MEYEIKYRPSYSMLVMKMDKGESIKSEAGALTYMSPSIDVETSTRDKSILKTIGMSLFGRQSLFVNRYVAMDDGSEVALVAAPVGDIETFKVTPKKGYIIQKSSYIASTDNVDLDVRWEGFRKGLFGQGLFMIRTSGSGQLFINTFGAIDKHVLKKGQQLVVDNFHLVAFSDTCDYTVEKFGGWKETILGGEGLVVNITGPGEVYIQTKSVSEFVNWLWTFIGPRVRAETARTRISRSR